MVAAMPRGSFAALALCLLATQGWAIEASFDCSKAKTNVERTICGSELTAGLDRLVAQLFKAKRDALPSAQRTTLKDAQVAWMKQRNADCEERFGTDLEDCVVESYEARVVALAGRDALVDFAEAGCAQDVWRCPRAGELELSRGDAAAAARAFGRLCAADHDGDGGASCVQQARVLRQLGRHDEATALDVKTCAARGTNEACANAHHSRALGGWSGLYRSPQGTVLLETAKDGTTTLSLLTFWANGHQCSWSGKGTFRAGSLAFKPDENGCAPEVTRKGEVLSVSDPSGSCRAQNCGARGSFEDQFSLEPDVVAR
jgi:uncharacterized protein